MSPTMESTGSSISRLFDEHELVGVVLQWKNPFYSRLKHFKKPENNALILVTPSHLLNKTPSDTKKHFDLILTYNESGEVSKTEAMFHVLDVAIKEIADIIQTISESTDSIHKMRIINFEEYLVGMAASLRDKYDLVGGKSKDVRRLANKSLLISSARDSGINVPLHITLSAAKSQSIAIESLLSELTESKLEFPLFVKPSNGVGCKGGMEVWDEQQLEQWLDEIQSDPKEVDYLVEPVIDKPEIFFNGIVTDNHNWTTVACFHSTRRLVSRSGFTPVYDYYCINENETEARFPGSTQFCQDICRKLKVPPGTIFVVQAFVMGYQHDYENFVSPHQRVLEYSLTEVSYRPIGSFSNAMVETKQGFSLEAMQILAGLDHTGLEAKKYRQGSIPQDKHQVYLVFSKIDGVLAGKMSIEQENGLISSTVNEFWHAEVGEKMKHGRLGAEYALLMELQNSNYAKMMKDTQYLMKNYKIIVS